jgi:hypothetical protein
VPVSIKAGVPNGSVEYLRAKVMVWFMSPTEIGRVADAELNLEFPPWLATISHKPTVAKVTVNGLAAAILQTPAEPEAIE